jgi:hypothetical protein
MAELIYTKMSEILTYMTKYLWKIFYNTNPTASATGVEEELNDPCLWQNRKKSRGLICNHLITSLFHKKEDFKPKTVLCLLVLSCQSLKHSQQQLIYRYHIFLVLSVQFNDTLFRIIAIVRITFRFSRRIISFRSARTRKQKRVKENMSMAF